MFSHNEPPRGLPRGGSLEICPDPPRLQSTFVGRIHTPNPFGASAERGEVIVIKFT